MIEENNISYMRQTDIFNPINQIFNIIILGAGSLGSIITFNLAKLGFNNIEVYDFDIVKNFNIPNQIYRIKDINKSKVEALSEIIEEFCNVKINIKNIKVDLTTKFSNSLNNIFILTFDTLEERKIFLNIIKNNQYKQFVVDARVGGEEFNIQTINTFNEEEIKEWEKSFDIIPTDLPCGAKSIIYTNFNIASEVCNVIKKINNGEPYPKKFFRHMKTYNIIHKIN